MSGTTRTGMAMRLAWALLALFALVFISSAYADCVESQAVVYRVAVKSDASQLSLHNGRSARISASRVQTSSAVTAVAAAGANRSRLRRPRLLATVCKPRVSRIGAKSPADNPLVTSAAPSHSVYALTQRLRL